MDTHTSTNVNGVTPTDISLSTSVADSSSTCQCPSSIVSISCGSEHCFAMSCCDIFVWGWNEHGNLGQGHQQILSIPTPISMFHCHPHCICRHLWNQNENQNHHQNQNEVSILTNQCSISHVHQHSQFEFITTGGAASFVKITTNKHPSSNVPETV
jgi:hypothetical protein